MDGFTRFIGGSPARVALQLILLSFVVGIVLTALGVHPFDIINGLQQLVERVWYSGFEAIEWAWRYFLLGAVIVIPVWFIMRVLRSGRSSRPPA